jgi:Tol biopolymer transport system component
LSSLVGRTLSHYRVTSAIGAGGMGEVYRATDTTLGRDVAIKVLPSDVASDRERLARFRREAHLLASLNHPNIAGIYGLEETDDAIFIALELVEGEDLKERLKRGPIPVDEAIDLATQVAEALEDAHNHGIVHRDLKPANVKLSSTGRVKVLDFGLAKALAGEASGSGSASPIVSHSPTLTHAATVAGVILGTAAYMAPEQARGKVVDRRADVWAFGVLLWEMLTGRTMFGGETVTDVIASVVTREPDLEALPAATPRAVKRLIARCLRKDPRQRLPDIGAARLELQEVKSGGGLDGAGEAPPPQAAAAGRGRTLERLAWAAALVLMAGAAGTLAFIRARDVPARPAAARFTIDPPAGWDFSTGFDWPVPSPDGRQVVFRAVPSVRDAPPESSMLWTRSLDSLTARPLNGTEGGTLPAWSPDGTSLAFVVGRELRRLNLANGTVQPICTSPLLGFGSLTWNDAGTLLFSAGADAGEIFSVSTTGGDPTLLEPPVRGTYQHMPQFLPDGKRFLFMLADPKLSGVYAASLAAPHERKRVHGFYRSLYASGYLLFVREGTLFAQPFDASRAVPSGDPVTIASPVLAWQADRRIGWFGVSPAGTLAYYAGQTVSSRVQLAWVDRAGATLTKIGEPESFGQLALSPDERTIAVEVLNADGEYDLWVMDVARGVTSRVTTTAGNERDPVWSPDGTSLVFLARSGQQWSLRRKGLRASDPERVIMQSPGDEHIPELWLRDGTVIVDRRNPVTDRQDSVWAVPVGGGPPVQVLSGVRLDEPQLSPDARWLAYVSRESGTDEVYVEPFRREGTRVRVSPRGGGQPKWRGDGQELFFLTPANTLAVVTVKTERERIDVSLPKELFDVKGVQGAVYDDYAPAADGQRFLVKLPAERQESPRLAVVTNWTSLVR